MLTHPQLTRPPLCLPPLSLKMESIKLRAGARFARKLRRQWKLWRNVLCRAHGGARTVRLAIFGTSRELESAETLDITDGWRAQP
jgi:hypothetical protein